MCGLATILLDNSGADTLPWLVFMELTFFS